MGGHVSFFGTNGTMDSNPPLGAVTPGMAIPVISSYVTVASPVIKATPFVITLAGLNFTGPHLPVRVAMLGAVPVSVVPDSYTGQQVVATFGAGVLAGVYVVAVTFDSGLTIYAPATLSVPV